MRSSVIGETSPFGSLVGVLDCVLNQHTDRKAFSAARDAGFAGVEVSVTRAELSSSPRDRLQHILAAAADTGLLVPSLMIRELSLVDMASADPVIAAAAIADVTEATRWASRLGAGVILVPFFGGTEFSSEADVERTARALRAACTLGSAIDVNVCYEGWLPAAAIARLARLVESDAFGCYFDLANPLRYGLDPVTEIRALGPLIRQVHIKDLRHHRRLVHPGLGTVDFEQCARALSDIGYNGWFVLETPAAPSSVVARDLAFTRRQFDCRRSPTAVPRFGAASTEFAEGDWDGLARTFRDNGLESIVLAGPLLRECLESRARARRAREALAEARLEIVALAGDRPLATTDAVERSQSVALVTACLELAPLLDAGLVIADVGPANAYHYGYLPPTDDTWLQLEKSIAELLVVAERCGTVLAIAAQTGTVVRCQADLLRLLDCFESEYLKIVCDPYRILSSDLLPAQRQQTQQYLERFEHQFVAARIGDVAAGGWRAGAGEFGTGVFCQPPYLDFLQASRPDLPLILDAVPMANLGLVRQSACLLIAESRSARSSKVERRPYLD
jgi:sugar phosphate isomerase/epimerase